MFNNMDAYLLSIKGTQSMSESSALRLQAYYSSRIRPATYSATGSSPASVQMLYGQVARWVQTYPLLYPGCIGQGVRL